MAKQYKALKPIGPWVKGNIIGKLPDEKIQQLLTDEIIQEVKSEVKPKTATKEVAK